MNVKVTNRDFLKQKVSDLLVSFKTENNITFQELAELLGTNYLQINRWIKKQTLPIPDKIQEICSTLGVDFTEFVGGTSCVLDRIDLSTVVNHYKFKAQDPDEQKKLLCLAVSLVYTYLCSRGVSPTLLMHTGTNALWSLSEPQSHDLHALYTVDEELDNLAVFGSSDCIKFQFLSESASEPVVLTNESLVNAVNHQLIKRTMLAND